MFWSIGSIVRIKYMGFQVMGLTYFNDNVLILKEVC